MVNHFCSEIISWCQQHNTWSESWVTAAAPPPDCDPAYRLYPLQYYPETGTKFLCLEFWYIDEITKQGRVV